MSIRASHILVATEQEACKALDDVFTSGDFEAIAMTPVSYTHLTLPTICSV